MTITASAIRRALEGVVIVSACGADGTPSVQLVGGCHYVDENHVALGYMNDYRVRLDGVRSGFSRLLAFDPVTARKYNVLLQHVRTETSGPVADFLRLRVAGVVSHQVASNLSPLGCADIYRILRIDALPCLATVPPTRPEILPALRQAASAIAAAPDVEALVDQTLDSLAGCFGVSHAMLLMREAGTERFVAIDSRGYEVHGSGAEVAAGEGVIGCAASMGVAVRIDNARITHARARAVLETDRPDVYWATAPVPLPGLVKPGSQLAIPIPGPGGVVAVLYCEDVSTYRFDADLEHAFSVLGSLFATALDRLERQAVGDTGIESRLPRPAEPPGRTGEPLQVRCEPRTNAIFVNGDYVIRGVAGAVLRRMLECHASTGQTEFTNRLLRHDISLPLPDLDDNLSARLIMLQRRLEQRPCGIRLRKAGRGRVALEVDRPLRMESEPVR